MKISSSVFIITLLTLIVLISTSVRAQQVTVVVNNNLTFGDVLPGVEKVVDKTEAGSAAVFHVSGPVGREITIQFNLPIFIKLGGNNMMIQFSATDLAMDSSSTQASNQANPGYDDLDPSVVTTYGVGANGLTLWLGGKVLPSTSQAQGSYSSDISIIVDTTAI